MVSRLSEFSTGYGEDQEKESSMFTFAGGVNPTKVDKMCTYFNVHHDNVPLLSGTANSSEIFDHIRCQFLITKR